MTVFVVEDVDGVSVGVGVGAGVETGTGGRGGGGGGTSPEDTGPGCGFPKMVKGPPLRQEQKV
jgi:hypothetical protein